MYEDRTQNYDQKVYEEYLVYEWYTLPLRHYLQPCADYNVAINTTN